MEGRDSRLGVGHVGPSMALSLSITAVEFLFLALRLMLCRRSLAVAVEGGLDLHHEAKNGGVIWRVRVKRDGWRSLWGNWVRSRH